jgi:hypothetical protein
MPGSTNVRQLGVGSAVHQAMHRLVILHSGDAIELPIGTAVRNPVSSTRSVAANLTRNRGDYRRIPLLAFFSRKAASKACICPLLRWMTDHLGALQGPCLC